MFDELAERSLMSPFAGTKQTYVRLAIIIHFKGLSGHHQSSGRLPCGFCPVDQELDKQTFSQLRQRRTILW